MSLTKVKINDLNMGRGKFLKLILVLLLIVLAAVYLFGKKTAWNFSVGQKSGDAYQAVSLTNGQVYFGQLNVARGDFMQLDDVYYLRVQRALQPAQAEDGVTPQEQTGISLVKLGNELHGPQNSMLINKDQVLFVEAMKDDSKVVQAIKKDKENKTE